MKRLEKVNLLKEAKGTYNLCRFYFNYDASYWYFYILDLSDKFILGIEEQDFMLNGFQIRKISDIKKVEEKDDLCIKINKEHELLKDVKKPNIDLSSWKSIFNSLITINKFIIIENEDLDEEEQDFAIGKIISVNNTSISFKEFDSDGVWNDTLLKIPFKFITSVTFNDRYSKTWEEFLTKIS